MKKNILLLFPDQHRGDWMPYTQDEVSVLGSAPLPLRMPNIRRLMDRGTTFTRAITNSPLCVPARACLALGQEYDRCGAWNNDFCCPLDQPTIYRILRDGGYTVSGVGKFDLHKPIMYWGEQGWVDQLGFLGFTEALESEGKGDAVWAYRHGTPGPYGTFMEKRGLMEEYCTDHLRRAKNATDSAFSDIPEEAYADNWVTENALSAIRRLSEKAAPWFLTVNFSGPHDPWDVTPEMKARWKNVSFPIPPDYTGDREALNGVQQNYAAMLENIDRNAGLILEELERLGQLENTVVIYASDHGEMLGDRNRFYKSLPYLPSVHIPLIISGPGARRGQVCEELVQLNDLAATIVEFAGLDTGTLPASRSLVPLTTREGAAPVREYQYAALYPHLRAEEDHYIPYEIYRKHLKRVKGLDTGDRSSKHLAWRSFLTREYQYIDYFEIGCEELYDLRRDPHQRVNLAKARPELLPEFRTLAARHREER